MIKKSFNEGWTVETAQLMEMAPSADYKKVTLPHDRTIELKRRYCPAEENPEIKKQEALCGGWPSGAYKYRKEFFVPEEWRDKCVYFEFEGVYRDAHVLIDDDFVLHHANGYTGFVVSADRFLRYGKLNNVTVLARNGADARWYAGAGIYRPVHMMLGNLMHIAPEGVHLHIESVDASIACVVAEFTVRNKSHTRRTVTAVTTIYDAEGQEKAKNMMQVTVFGAHEERVRQRFAISDPKLWDAEHPYLYTAKTILKEKVKKIDSCEECFGIRTMTLDAKRGLCINGKEVKLRGGAVHADNGPLGMATFTVSEERRVRKMKEAGFNAIRMAHHPASRALLEACDRQGMYIMDELCDQWGRGKTTDDYANAFQDNWKKDVKAMVQEAYNHPSVIMYSIGNEIGDIGYGIGAHMGRKIAATVKELDPHRWTINCINGLVGIAAMNDEIPKEQQTTQGMDGQQRGDINNAMTDLVQMMETIMKMPVVDESTSESFSCVDIAGYNYMESRYEQDCQLYPDRIICGSETYPPKIAYNWNIVKKLTNLIGDFTWAGWDYLGEAGIAAINYNGKDVYKNYPYRTAYTGDIDIIGNRRPLSYYREIVFGQRKDPYIAVCRPEYYGQEGNKSPWAWSDSVSCWTWEGFEGKPVKVEVYADAEEVELLYNEKSLGRKSFIEEKQFIVTFDTVYEPGELTAVAYSCGKETGRYQLCTAKGEHRICIEPEVSSIEPGYDSLVYFAISMSDKDGNLFGGREKIQVEVEGSGSLIALSSGAPAAEEEFFEQECRLYDGRALAIVRAENRGEMRLRVAVEDRIYISNEVTVL